MAAPQNHGPVQILSFNKSSKKFELNNAALNELLLAENVRDHNISVISIAGAFRKGKSFMLSFFLRYLNETYPTNKADWLGVDSTRLEGFSWRGGSERHTTGLWVWSKIFTTTNSKGEKIAIMLMDTQGTFDTNSTMSHNVTIFSLSTMLSSVQIFNLFNNIQEDDLQHLQLFTEYGKLAMQNTNEKAFQMLLFLIRDWSYPYEAPYGFEGGRQILEKRLEVSEGQEDELKYVRQHIKSCYEKIDCFLMPHPGRIATMSQHFTGQLKDIDQEFKDQLKSFVPAMLHPDNVMTKKIAGGNIKAKNLIAYIESYWNMFASGGVPTAHTILDATAEANNLSSKEEAMEYYQAEMRKHTANDVEIKQFGEMVDLHNTTARVSMDIFKKKAVIGDDRLRSKHQTKLSAELQSQLMLFLGQNEAKKAKSLSETIDSLSGQIDAYRSTNTEQTEVMNSLKNQMEVYRQSSDEEKRLLREQIEALRRDLDSAKSSGGKKCTIL